MLLLGAVWLFGVWPPPVWWRAHWPRCTAMMRLRDDCPALHPTLLKDISPLLQRMVIIAEDSRFRTHHGLDWEEIKDAVRHRRDRMRGASTITQQLAKNLYLSPSRNPFRKVTEAVTALRLELALSKERILELYLNVAEWGPGVWGVGAASRTYFGVPPSGLDETQAAELAATLPFPRTANPALRSSRMLARRDLILARFHGVDVYIPPVDEPDTILAIPPIVVPIIPPVLDTMMDTIKVPVDSLHDSSGTRDPSRKDKQLDA